MQKQWKYRGRVGTTAGARLAVAESCTADLVATSISWEAECSFDTEGAAGSEEDNGTLATCGKYKVSPRLFSDSNLVEY
jgi:hypothetical protein